VYTMHIQSGVFSTIVTTASSFSRKQQQHIRQDTEVRPSHSSSPCTRIGRCDALVDIAAQLLDHSVAGNTAVAHDGLYAPLPCTWRLGVDRALASWYTTFASSAMAPAAQWPAREDALTRIWDTAFGSDGTLGILPCADGLHRIYQCSAFVRRGLS
jgi:hypothetical protein